MGAKRGKTANRSTTLAINAAQSFSRLSLATAHGSVLTTANQHGDVRPAWITNSEPVSSAAEPSPSTATVQRGRVRDHVPQKVVTVVGVKRLNKRAPVYNLTVDAVHEYYANGVLVHNCDAARYLAWGLRHMGASE
jgi:hypothetical protein